MPSRPRPTRKLLDRIVANYWQTGDLTDAAIRSGVSRSTLYDWKRRGEKANSGPLAEFAQNFMPLRPKPTREHLDRIVANYRQTGDLTNAAIRSGISRSTLYEWKRRGEEANSGLLAEFAKNLTCAREDLIAVETMRHQQLAQGSVIRLPVYDHQGRVMKDENGEVETREIQLLPNLQALETRLRWKAPDRYPGKRAKRSAPPDELPPPSEEYEKPRQVRSLDDVLADAQARAIKSKQSKTTAKEDQEADPRLLERDKD
jgi:transposase